MAKRGFTKANVSPVLKYKSSSRGWALCVGAGISRPLFPSWNKLVYDLLKKNVDSGILDDTYDILMGKFSPDALIQAAHDQLDLEEDEFTDLLQEKLYQNVRDKLNSKEWDKFTKALSKKHIGDIGRESWIDFLEIVKNQSPTISSLTIANVLTDIYGTKLAPDAILSFNAEPLLYSLINALTVEKRWPKGDENVIPDVLDRLTHSISNRRPNRIPYYFCHGLLPVPSQKQEISGSDKLVFSESEYLELANNSFSWQSSAFLDLAMSKSIVFIGVSLSDPNMRRWLSWIHTNRVKEINVYNGDGTNSTAHFWIAKDPGVPTQKRWIESTVSHLGVRLVWIDKWTDIEETLREMLELAN